MMKPTIEAVLVEDVVARETADGVTSGEGTEADDTVGGGGIGVVAVGEKAIEMKMLVERGNIGIGRRSGGGEERTAEEGEEIGEEREEEERE
ncbi:hypothetical protein SDJN03_07060, partial [Cucurbita argyrosperma subsp. sororia]